MVLKEHITYLKDLNACYRCGEKSSKKINIDHRIPKCMLYLPSKEQISHKSPFNAIKEHPLFKVVADKSNHYPVCKDHHKEIDDKKISRFLEYWKIDLNDLDTFKLDSKDRGDPVALMKWLHRNYPWSADPYYFEVQRKMVWRSNQIFKTAVENMGEFFTPNITERYQKAAQLVDQYDQQIHCLPSLYLPRPKSSIFDQPEIAA